MEVIAVRPYRESDREPFRRLFADERVMAHVGGVLEPSKADALFERFLAGPDERFPGAWAVEWLESGEYAGHVALYLPAGSRTPEISFLVDPRFQGRGIATEAAGLVIAHAPFEVIRATVDPDHPASLRVLEKVGMSFEREEKDREGRYLVYSIVRR